MLLGNGNRQGNGHKTQKLAARISHKHYSRMGIKPQKTKTRPHNGYCYDRDGGIIILIGQICDADEA